jgi:hypothetical protein
MSSAVVKGMKTTFFADDYERRNIPVTPTVSISISIGPGTLAMPKSRFNALKLNAVVSKRFIFMGYEFTVERLAVAARVKRMVWKCIVLV